MIKAFLTDKRQVADILEEIISWIGPSKIPSGTLSVRQATFSISEEFLRRIWRIKKATGARFVLAIDRKALAKTRQLWKFVSMVYDEVYLSDTHAKILLIDPVSEDIPKYSVITSQNLTRGNRHESTVILDNPEVFSSLSDDFYNLIRKKSVPMHEIMPVPDCQPELPDSSGPGSDDVISTIEKLSSIFLPISDIATIIEMNPAQLRMKIQDESSPESVAYRRGKAKAKAKIRAQEMELAQLGSPLGVQNVRDNLIDMESEEF